jgi:hypothetical protein
MPARRDPYCFVNPVPERPVSCILLLFNLLTPIRSFYILKPEGGPITLVSPAFLSTTLHKTRRVRTAVYIGAGCVETKVEEVSFVMHDTNIEGLTLTGPRQYIGPAGSGECQE